MTQVTTHMSSGSSIVFTHRLEYLMASMTEQNLVDQMVRLKVDRLGSMTEVKMVDQMVHLMEYLMVRLTEYPMA